MNSRLFLGPPKVRLATVSGTWMMPSGVPSGANTSTPRAELIQSIAEFVDAQAIRNAVSMVGEDSLVRRSVQPGRHRTPARGDSRSSSCERELSAT